MQRESSSSLQTCTKCGRSLPHTVEHFRNAGHGKLTVRCRVCLLDDEAARRRSRWSPEKIAEREDRERLAASGKKRCRTCSRVLPATPEFFSRHHATRDGLRHECRPCCVSLQQRRYKSDPERFKAMRADRYARQSESAKRYAAAWYAENREHAKDVARRGHYRRRYGCTPEHVEELLSEQGGVCAVCGTKPPGKWHLDHDHDTGMIRGVLCQRCNQAIGLLGNDPERCDAAASYLRHPTRLW